MLQKETITSVFCLYILSFFKYIFFSPNYIDIEFILSNIFFALTVFINSSLNTILVDGMKFCAQNILVMMGIFLLSGLLSFIYSIVFYFGLVTTTIFVYLLYNMIDSGLLRDISGHMNRFYGNHSLLKKINHDSYLYSFCSDLWEWFNNILLNYAQKIIWPICKFLFCVFLAINMELSDNFRSNVIKDKMKKRYEIGKKYFSENYIFPYITKTITNNFTKNTPKSKNKNTDIQLDMNFLNDTQIIKNDIEDLDDDDNNEQEQNEQVNEEIKEDIKQVDIKEVIKPVPKPIKVQENASGANQKSDRAENVLDKKAALRRKLAEKKAARTGTNVSMPRNKKEMKNSVAEMMKMPGMDEMVGSMLQGDNLQNMLKNLPKEKMNLDMSAMNTDIMKEMAQFIKQNNKT